MTVWPGSLPQSFLMQGYSQQKKPMSIESEVDFGPAIVRRRYSAASEIIQGRMLMTTAQWETVIAFKETTLNDVEVFDWVHPVTGDAKSVRFVSKDATALAIVANLTGDLYIVNLLLEFLA